MTKNAQRNMVTVNTASKILSELSRDKNGECDIDNGDDLVLEDEDSPVKVHKTDQAVFQKTHELFQKEKRNSEDKTMAGQI